MASHLSARFVAVSLIALATAGCASMGVEKQVEVIGHTETEGMDPIASAAYWGTRYDRTPTDPKVAVSFSKALRAVDNNEEALRVIQHASVRIGDDADVLLEVGKALIANDRAHEAVRPIERSIAMGNVDDWSAHSALGVAYDKIGKHGRARRHYDTALTLAPNKAQILNNKGLSYALAGDARMAERTLRIATTAPDGSSRMRQNLALVLALNGRTTEAERLARSDLPPSVADQNVSYYQNLVRGPAYWQDLDSANVDLPDFGDDPNSISLAPQATPVPDPADAPKGRRGPGAPTPGPIKGTPAPSATVQASVRPTVPNAAPAAGAPMALAYRQDEAE